MSATSCAAEWRRRTLAWALGWVGAGALYLLLIDITDLPELIVGAGVAVVAASGFELARARDPAGQRARLRWALTLHRALLRVPWDVVAVSLVAIRQLVRPRATVGTFRTMSFRAGGEPESVQRGRRALAESMGSFAPNTIVIGSTASGNWCAPTSCAAPAARSRSTCWGSERDEVRASRPPPSEAGVNPWEIAATALGFALIACALVAALSGPAHGRAAIELSSVLLTTILMLLAEGFHRQPFIDLAVVFALMGTIGSLTFARVMERQL